MLGFKKVNHDVFRYYNRLGRVQEYIEANYAEEISLDSAARVATMESSYFSNYFHKKVGIRFGDWVRQVRVEKAIELIKSSNHSLTYVAYEVGFADLRAFERAFKKCMGMTPFQYKKSVRPDALRG